jgi:hypothetical protein
MCADRVLLLAARLTFACKKCRVCNTTCFLFPQVNSRALQWVEPAVHACRSETALGCTVQPHDSSDEGGRNG